MIAPVRRPRLVRQLGLASLWVATATSAGCGGAGTTSVPLYPSSGQVLSNGKPVAGVQVTFRPIVPEGQNSPAPVPIARTDKDGKFRLATTVGEAGQAVDGAPAGDYAVALVAARSDSADFLRKDAASPTSATIDARFSNPETSGLKATIKPGENTLEPFDLKASGRANPPIGSDDRGR